MKDFNKVHGWLYEMVGGPADRLTLRIDTTRKQTPGEPPHLEEVPFSAHPEGVYRRQRAAQVQVKYDGEFYPSWHYVWTPHTQAVAA